MLRKLIILGVCAGTSASIPMLYESNPGGLGGIFRQMTAEQTPDRTVAAALPKAQAVAPQAVSLQGRKVRLDGDARGHFNADFRLNGRPVKALVDTGATLVAINRSTARRIGIALRPADFKYKVDTANGTARAASAMIDSIQIGKIYIENVQAMVLDDEALGGTLVGMSFLKRLDGFRVEDGALTMAQ